MVNVLYLGWRHDSAYLFMKAYEHTVTCAPGNLVDYLSILYFKKRNYLSGFLLKLRELEEAGKIKIHMAKRTFIGSLYIEGYSVIAWSPVFG